jgi:hypothetical protein
MYELNTKSLSMIKSFSETILVDEFNRGVSVCYQTYENDIYFKARMIINGIALTGVVNIKREVLYRSQNAELTLTLAFRLKEELYRLIDDYEREQESIRQTRLEMERAKAERDRIDKEAMAKIELEKKIGSEHFRLTNEITSTRKPRMIDI